MQNETRQDNATPISKEMLESWYQNKSQKDLMIEASESEQDEDFVFDNGSKYEILPQEYE